MLSKGLFLSALSPLSWVCLLMFHLHFVLIYVFTKKRIRLRWRGRGAAFIKCSLFSVGSPFSITAGADILYLCFLVLDLLCFDSFPFLDQHISAAVNVHSVLSLFLTGSDFSIRGIKIRLDLQFCLYRPFSLEISQTFFWYFDFVWFKVHVVSSVCLDLVLVFELSAFLHIWTFCMIELSIWLTIFCLILLSVSYTDFTQALVMKVLLYLRSFCYHQNSSGTWSSFP